MPFFTSSGWRTSPAHFRGEPQPGMGSDRTPHSTPDCSLVVRRGPLVASLVTDPVEPAPRSSCSASPPARAHATCCPATDRPVAASAARSAAVSARSTPPSCIPATAITSTTANASRREREEGVLNRQPTGAQGLGSSNSSASTSSQRPSRCHTAPASPGSLATRPRPSRCQPSSDGTISSLSPK